MATNPSIILSGNNINDVITDQRAKLAQADAMQKAGQLQDLQLSQAKQAFDDEKNFRRAYMEANGDPALTIKTAANLGVSPTRIQAFQKTQSEMLTQALTQHKLQADTGKTELETQDIKNSEIHGALAPVLNASPDKFESAKTFVISDLVRRKVLTDPAEIKAAAGMSQDDLKLYSAHLLNVAQISDEAKGQGALQNADSSKRQADVAEDKLALEKAKGIKELEEKTRVDSANKLSNALRAGGPAGYAKALEGIDPKLAAEFPTPQQIATSAPKDGIGLLDGMAMTGHERAQVQQARENAAETAKRDANAAANQLANLKLRQTEVSISAKREAREESQVGLNVGPDGISPTAKNIFDGMTDPLTARAMIRKNPGLTDQVIKYAESKGKKWDEGKLEARFNTIKDLTNTSTGKPGGQLLSASTTVQHAGLFAEAVDAINNGSFVPGNAVFNKFNETFGQAAPNDLTIVAHFLSGEAAKLATGNAPQKAELDAMNKALNRDKSPQALKSAAQTLIKLGAGRLYSIKELADSHDITDDVVRIVTPDTAEALQKAGIDPKTLKTAQKTAAASAGPKLSNFKATASGPNGHKIGSNDGGNTWYDVSTGKPLQ